MPFTCVFLTLHLIDLAASKSLNKLPLFSYVSPVKFDLLTDNEKKDARCQFYTMLSLRSALSIGIFCYLSMYRFCRPILTVLLKQDVVMSVMK